MTKLPATKDELRAALETAGFRPDFNVCSACRHHGGDHDLGNWCLICPRPRVVVSGFEGRIAAGWCYFASMTKDEEWNYGLDVFRATLIDRVVDRGV
jgi:hypothetical protein